MKILGRLVGTPQQQQSCRQVRRLLQSFLDGELDDDGARRVSAHLDDCRRCGLEAETFRAIKDALAGTPTGTDDASLGRLREFAAALSDPGSLSPSVPR